MKLKTLMQACLCGMALSVAVMSPAQADTLRILSGATQAPLTVPLNRAVVVESDTPFSELSIANPGIADIQTLSDRSIYVLGKVPGRTTLTILGADGKLVSNVDVQVTPDLAEFKERLKQILPGENIQVRTANDGIVLSGTVSSAQKLSRALELANRYAPDRVSNLMMVGGTQQVMLKVRFAEMQRSVAKSLSSSINAGVGPRGTYGQAGGYGGINLDETTARTGTYDNGIGLGLTRGTFQLGVLIQALENKGVVRTLAEPNLTALSGQSADFLAGGEYPIPVLNNGDVSIQYKPFGVEMSFTPRVVDGDVINLEIAASVSSIDTANGYTSGTFNVSAFKKRSTSTTVEMRDGESFAIAGLLQDDFNDSVGQIPWLGDVPVLGALFRSTEFERKQSELVIIVTPHLVSPVKGDTLALPTDRLKPPTESELFLNGRTSGGKAPQKGPAAEVAKQDFSGSYGYVME
ncbi:MULTISPECIES: type II and III secretion system protein family protein [unclassified Thioclava]|uniref:type II and III secretion system protein family protein n=1 Tax=unclassified Thioclava TaxID=2621713 RepID=UPI000996113F|nr:MULTISPECIES: type II and III secretion system protein family protein [unclassified Thioclava]OOY04364.1 general secretion pathway protein [Thioclava sp. F28-4]OOY08026.1 general secretion pathway protein [Thioclava sp. F36-7]